MKRYLNSMARVFLLTAGILFLAAGCDAVLTSALQSAVGSTTNALVDEAFTTFLNEFTDVPTTTTTGIYSPTVGVNGTSITLPSTLMPTVGATPTPIPTSTSTY